VELGTVTLKSNVDVPLADMFEANSSYVSTNGYQLVPPFIHHS